MSLDSMIVDISAVFEGYARAVISESSRDVPGVTVKDGNFHHTPFFTSGDSPYRVQPDIIIEKDGKVTTVFDVKYKPTIHEQDRYELLAFMEATGAKHAAFICPKVTEADQSKYIGTTGGGRSMGIIRVDLAAEKMSEEETRLFSSVMKVVEGRYDFEMP